MNPVPQDHPALTGAGARPDTTAALMARTGLSEPMIDAVVRAFYGRARRDPLLGPVFEAAILDWEPHLARIAAFWSSVALMTGRYHGRPVQRHLGLPLDARHFGRWLLLWRATAEELCPPVGAAALVAAAERIAAVMMARIEEAAPPA